MSYNQLDTTYADTTNADTTGLAPIEDPARLSALQRLDILDTPPEAAFDRLTALASRLLHAPVALVSLVDHNRQFFKSQVGLTGPWADARQTPLSHSFCKYVVASEAPLIVQDAREDPRLRDNPAIAELGAVAYAGMPMTTSEGQTLGSFCALDNKPREWTAEEMATLRDLTALVMTEVELRQRLQQVHQQYVQLQDLQQQRDDLTHMIVHDLRTPLTSVLGGVQTVPLLGEVNVQQQEALELSVQDGYTLLGMINDLFDISKMESHSLTLDTKLVTAADLIEAAIRQIRSLAAEKELRLRIEVASDLPSCEADEGKLVRTLVNLLGNAIKFTPRGGTITVSVRAGQDPKTLLFAVKDTGEGIPPEAFTHIFEKFGQVASRQGGRSMSTGLGLTFCRMVVEAHGGHIWVESALGKGSTFSFCLPCHRKPAS